MYSKLFCLIILLKYYVNSKYSVYIIYFLATTPYNVIQLEESVSCTKCHRESGLLALCNEDFTITLVDIDTMIIVRKFDGHHGKINDITFDAQSRWVF